MALITLTTDFGPGKYVAAMKGIILGINPAVNIIDVSHEIRPQNVREGAFVLFSSLRYFPHGVHVGVVDPGVGGDRKDIVMECERGILVGPDNGLLAPAARNLGLKRVFEIRNPKYVRPPVHPTFHGRDVLAPAAAYLSAGVGPEVLGPELDEFVELSFGRYEVTPGELRGVVLYVDRFGNLITNIPREALEGWAKLGDPLVIHVEGRGVVGRFQPSYAFGNREEPLVMISSSEMVEIAVVNGRASNLLEAREGAPISVGRP